MKAASYPQSPAEVLREEGDVETCAAVGEAEKCSAVGPVEEELSGRTPWRRSCRTYSERSLHSFPQSPADTAPTVSRQHNEKFSQSRAAAGGVSLSGVSLYGEITAA